MELPPLPSYTAQPLASLIPGIPDGVLSVTLPIVAYWAFSMVFHAIDMYDLFPQYRLHTPAEVLKRNHVSRWEVVRDVLIQQVLQAIIGGLLAYFEPEAVVGKDEYNVAVWAQRIRLAQRHIPQLFAITGLDAKALAQKAIVYSPSVAGALIGGLYPSSFDMVNGKSVPSFATWEIVLAKAIYWCLVPLLQFTLAIVIVDTWQYFLHRAMHMNKWLYTTFHSRHHRLYVPYAYGALYNHPFEGFLLDTCGAGLAYLVSGMTPRQGMVFFVGSTLKTVDDHCGYAFPWDPLQHLTSNNAGYHDVHHQSWGIKTNFSQPFFTFWDRLLGTAWTGGDVSLRYERARLAAEKKVQQEQGQKAALDSTAPITSSHPIDSILAKSSSPYTSSAKSATTTPRTTSIKPSIPPGKASSQAADSRAQILNDPSPAGGFSVLAQETAEEEREHEAAQQCEAAQSTLRFLRRSPRKKSSLSSQPPAAVENLKGLKELVVGSTGVSASSVRSRRAANTGHGYTGRGKVLGYESSM